MVVLQLQDASSVDSLASARTNPDICKSPVQSTAISRKPNLKRKPVLLRQAPGLFPLGQPPAHNPDVLMAPKCCAIGKILGGHAKRIAGLKMSS
jgi:hypothetical protein